MVKKKRKRKGKKIKENKINGFYAVVGKVPNPSGFFFLYAKRTFQSFCPF